jgi:hypothetical protein
MKPARKRKEVSHVPAQKHNFTRKQFDQPLTVAVSFPAPARPGVLWEHWLARQRRRHDGLELCRARRDPQRTHPHLSPLAVSPFFTSQSTKRLTASPARTNLTWCKALRRPAHRVKPLPAPRRTSRSSICPPLLHPASMRFMLRFSLRSPMGHTRSQASYGVNSSQTKSLPRARMMVLMPSSRHLGAAVLACGFRLLRHFFHICCRNGDSLYRLR